MGSTAASTSRSSCLPHEEFSHGLCYRKCKDGQTGTASSCAKQCPATGQFESLGPLCEKIAVPRATGSVPQIEPCLPPLQDNGRDCVDPLRCTWPNQCAGTGLTSVPYESRLKCKGPNQELVNQLCFDKCPKGYRGHGNKCYPDCPPGFKEVESSSSSSVSRHCVKPTQGRGMGQYPQNTPLQIISQSPNGSTLLNRYRAGQTPASVAKASASNFFGSNAGDPSNSNQSPSLLGDSSGGSNFIGDFINIFWTVATNIGNAIFPPSGGPIATLVAVGVFLLLLQQSPTILTFFFTRTIDAGISGFSSITSTAVGAVGKISEAAGTAVQRAERGLGSAVAGAEEFVGTVGSTGLEQAGKIGRGAIRGATDIAVGAVESAESLGNVAGRTFVQSLKPGAQLVSREAAAPTVSEIVSQAGPGIPSGAYPAAAAAAGGFSIPMNSTNSASSWIENLSPEMRAQLMQLLTR